MLPSWFVFHLERLLDTLHILPQPLSLCSCISGRLNYQVLFLFAASLVVSNLIMWIQIPTSPFSCICISKQGRACHFENISNTSPRITSTGFQMKCSILLCLLAYLGCSWYTFPPPTQKAPGRCSGTAAAPEDFPTRRRAMQELWQGGSGQPSLRTAPLWYTPRSCTFPLHMLTTDHRHFMLHAIAFIFHMNLITSPYEEIRERTSPTYIIQPFNMP